MNSEVARVGAASGETEAVAPKPPRWHWVVLFLSLAGAFVLQQRGLEDKSPTADEWAHLTRGILYWQTGDPRTSFGHPPLPNAVAALPVAFDSNNPDLTESKYWETARAGKVALRWLRNDYDTPRAHLITARRTMVVFLLAFIVYAYFFTARFFGLTAAVIVAVLAAFHPTLIGQARYVTTDFPAALGALVAAGELTRYLGSTKRYPIATMTLAMSFAILCKHSMVVLVLLAAVIAIAAAALGVGRFADRKPRARLALAAGHLVLTVLVVGLSINVAYRFQETGMTVQEILDKPEADGSVSRRASGQVFERYTPLPSWPPGLRIPLPYTYLYGVATMRGYDKLGTPSWFWGKTRSKGSVWYFPVLFLIKNPLAWLAGLVLALVALVRRQRPDPATAAFGLVGLGFFAIALTSSLNLGVRHVLPTIAIFTPYAAWGLGWAAGLRFRWARPLTIGAIVSMPLVAIHASPNFLGYFNVLAGGRSGGHKVSLVAEDWGQDRVALARLVEEKGLTPLYYDVQTATRKLEADWLQIPYEPYRCKGPRPEDAWVAVHAFRVEVTRCFAWLRDRTPDYVVNDHIRVYYIDDRADDTSGLRSPIEGTRPADQEGAEPPRKENR